MDKKTLLLAQVFMTFLMAITMSGIMAAFHHPMDGEFVSFWLSQFVYAWPIAFVMTQIWSRVAFPLAFILMARLRRDAA